MPLWLCMMTLSSFSSMMKRWKVFMAATSLICHSVMSRMWRPSCWQGWTWVCFHKSRRFSRAKHDSWHDMGFKEICWFQPSVCWSSSNHLCISEGLSACYSFETVIVNLRLALHFLWPWPQEELVTYSHSVHLSLWPMYKKRAFKFFPCSGGRVSVIWNSVLYSSVQNYIK